MARRGSLASRFPPGPWLALSMACLWGCPQLLSDDFLVVARSDGDQDPSVSDDAGTSGSAGAGSADAGTGGSAGVVSAAGSAGAGSVQNNAGAGGSSTTLRAVKQTLTPVRDRNLTGNFRSDNVYGDNSCVFDDPQGTICIGDSSNSNSIYRGFLTFDLSALPADTQGVSAAQLSLTIDSIRNTPFAVLGTLQAEHVTFSTINLAALDAPALGSAVNISSSGAVNSTLSADVLALVQDDVPARGRSQIRLGFSVETNSDGVGDLIEVLWSTPKLELTVLVP